MVIFTDLDGTLLDHDSYRADAALPGLWAAQMRGVPVVFCSSKTRAEIEALQKELQVRAPFIAENGGAAFIPAGAFPFALEASRRRDAYDVLELGTPYSQLVTALRLLRNHLPQQLVGFSDLTTSEVAAECGLPVAAAARARLREYDEPFRPLEHEPVDEAALRERITRAGLRCSRGGRFWHLHGANDKGAAVARLSALYRRQYGELRTIGLGDSANDLSMLMAVDRPVIVRKPDGSHDAALSEQLPHALRTQGIGPHGWAEAVQRLLQE